MLGIPRVLSVYAAGTAERRWYLANYRKQPDGDQSELHDQPLGMASICPTSAEFQFALPAGFVYLRHTISVSSQAVPIWSRFTASLAPAADFGRGRCSLKCHTLRANEFRALTKRARPSSITSVQVRRSR